MIRIQVWRREEGMVLLTQGHAGYAEAGKDIVCAGVSVLLYGFWSYLETQSRLCGKGDVHADELDGGLYVRSRGFEGKDIQAWEVMRAGICLLSQCYPKNVNYVENYLCEEETEWKK